MWSRNPRNCALLYNAFTPTKFFLKILRLADKKRRKFSCFGRIWGDFALKSATTKVNVATKRRNIAMSGVDVMISNFGDFYQLSDFVGRKKLALFLKTNVMI
jgi:hypothetical protein